MTHALCRDLSPLRTRLISWALALFFCTVVWVLWNLGDWLGHASSAAPVYRPAHSLFEMLLPL